VDFRNTVVIMTSNVGTGSHILSDVVEGAAPEVGVEASGKASAVEAGAQASSANATTKKSRRSKSGLRITHLPGWNAPSAAQSGATSLPGRSVREQAIGDGG